MQLLKAKKGKIIHIQLFSPATPDTAMCGKSNFLPTDKATADTIVERGGSWCPACRKAQAVADMLAQEPDEPAEPDELDEPTEPTEPALTPDQSVAVGRVLDEVAQAYTDQVAFRAVRPNEEVTPPHNRASKRAAVRAASGGRIRGNLVGRVKATASLWTHRAYQDVPGGTVLVQAIGGGAMRPARSRDQRALKGVR